MLRRRRLLYGVGLNDADYNVKKMGFVGFVDGKRKEALLWVCPFYAVWKEMLRRAYSAEYKERYPTYQDVSVCTEWHKFSVFRVWMEGQNWSGKQLDKDLLVSGNKVYSPSTCIFVSCAVNNFLTESGAARGDYPIGVSWDGRRGKFLSRCQDPETGVRKHLGYFDCISTAHRAWLGAKLSFARTLAAQQADERVAEALVKRYENYGGAV